MDSERKHELQTNDLREFLDNFKDFWDKNGNFLLIFLIVVLGGWLGYAKYNQWKVGQMDKAYAELDGADSPDALRAVAGEHSRVHDEAMRRSADAALGQARSALIADDADEAKAALKKAGSAYTALADRGATTEYQLIGNEGLAKVAIMREEWDKAATHYNKIIELAGETFLAQADRAKRALDRMDLLKDPIAFAPPEEAPAPTPPPAPGSDDPADRIPSLPPLPLPPAE